MGFLVGFHEKKDEIRKIQENFRGLGHDVGIPRSSIGSRCGVAERRLGQASTMPRRSTVHTMEIFVLCFVSFFRCYEDLSIGVIRTL